MRSTSGKQEGSEKPQETASEGPSWQVGDMVRVTDASPVHRGRVGYINLIGNGPSKRTVILCTRKEYAHGASNLFAVDIDRIEKV